jgi:hypothetical protein
VGQGRICLIRLACPWFRDSVQFRSILKKMQGRYGPYSLLLPPATIRLIKFQFFFGECNNLFTGTGFHHRCQSPARDEPFRSP